MADSIPSLRRRLAEAQAEIAALRSREPAVEVREVVREVPVEVIRYVDRFKEVTVEVDRYVDRFKEVPVEVERVRYERVEIPVVHYVTDPANEAAIRELQEALRQCQSSQSGS